MARPQHLLLKPLLVYLAWNEASRNPPTPQFCLPLSRSISAIFAFSCRRGFWLCLPTSDPNCKSLTALGHSFAWLSIAEWLFFVQSSEEVVLNYLYIRRPMEWETFFSCHCSGKISTAIGVKQIVCWKCWLQHNFKGFRISSSQTHAIGEGLKNRFK